jgi:hypothetical protein
MGQRVKHLAEAKDKPSIAALAREYDVAMRKYVRWRLREHLPEDRLGPAMDLLLGEHSPHEWPIQRPEIEALGLVVTPAAASGPIWSTATGDGRGDWTSIATSTAPRYSSPTSGSCRCATAPPMRTRGACCHH